MWAQTWSGIMDLVIPYPDATQVDATPAMLAQVNEHELGTHTHVYPGEDDTEICIDAEGNRLTI